MKFETITEQRCVNPACNKVIPRGGRITQGRCGTCYEYYRRTGRDRTWNTYQEGKKHGGFKAGRRHAPYEKCKYEDCIESGRGGGSCRGYCRKHSYIIKRKEKQSKLETIVIEQTRTYCPCCGRKLIIKCSGAPDCRYDGTEE